MAGRKGKILVLLCSTLMLLAMAGIGHAAVIGPITFASDSDYNNNNPNTAGVFRDVLDGVTINRGLDLSGTGHTALNFTGSDSNQALDGSITLYDSNPTDGFATLWTGNMTMSADIIIDQFNNAKGAGLLTLFNEGVGQTGLALYLWDAGNSDKYSINLVQQTGVTRPGNTLASVALGGGIPEDQWFRLNMGLAITGSNFTITGTVFGHTITSDPNSALGSQVGSTLVYNGVFSSALQDPYEVGLVARGDSATVNTSVTNFTLNASAVPEPGTLILLGSGLMGLVVAGRKKFRK